MTRPRVRQARALLAVAVLSVAAVACSHGSSGSAPALSGRTTAGDTWDLGSQRGHWVVVAFQASTCVPCRKELPGMRSFAEAHPDVRVVSVGLAETDADFAAFLAPFHLPWPAIADRQGYISDRWKVESLPVTVVVDPAGHIHKRFGTGVSASAALAAAVT